MENVGIFYGYLVHFTAIENILGHFLYFVVIWYIFLPLWYFVPRKFGNPAPRHESQ
jgi:hypothetical protein